MLWLADGIVFGRTADLGKEGGMSRAVLNTAPLRLRSAPALLDAAQHSATAADTVSSPSIRCSDIPRGLATREVPDL
jgi:hypothetical protein